MPVNLSIKEVPDALADGLRRRAARNHRSLQRELMVIIEAAVSEPAASALAVRAAEPAASAYVSASDARDRPASEAAFAGAGAGGNAGGDGLLAALDTVVAGSRWGHAPLLTREQANDRRLQREFEFDARQLLSQSQQGAAAS